MAGVALVQVRDDNDAIPDKDADKDDIPDKDADTNALADEAEILCFPASKTENWPQLWMSMWCDTGRNDLLTMTDTG